MRLGALALAAVLLAACAGGAAGQDNPYDPCQTITQLYKGDPFVFGLAFWPGGTLANWGLPENITLNNTAAGLTGPNPCLQSITVNWNGTEQTINYTKYLADRGVIFATYAIQVDTMAAVLTTRNEMDQIWDFISAGAKKVMSVVAFRGPIRSEAHYVRSSDPKETGGTGIVDQLALTVAMDNGVLQYFQWGDFGCGGCSSENCVETQYNEYTQQYPETACATPFTDCTCRGISCYANNCTTTVYAGFRGTDKAGRPLQTAYQIEQVNKYSITSLFGGLANSISNFFSNLGGSTSSSTSTAASTTLPSSGAITGADLQAVQAAQASVGFSSGKKK